MKMNIYSFPTFNLTKILLTAEELGTPYKLNMLDITKGEHKLDAHIVLHPLGKVPAVEIDDKHYFESNSICRLLCEKNNYQLYGNTPEERANVNQWVDFAALHVGRWLTVLFFERNIKPALFDGDTDPSAVNEAENFLAQQLPVIENQLSKHTWLAGEQYSLADIVTFSYFSTIELSKVNLDDYPNIAQWMNKITNKESYHKAMKNLPQNDMFAMLKAA